MRKMVAVVFLACGDDPLQGTAYAPDTTLPVGPPTIRTADGAVACGAGGGASCDASVADVIVVPTVDASSAPTNTCETAKDMGTLSGDTASPSLSAKGTCSEWLKLRATEDDNSVFGKQLKLAIKLTPPANQDLDLFAFFDPAKDVTSCAAPFATSQNPGAGVAESIALAWGEGAVANGADEGRTVNVLVLYASGSCSSGEQWSLTVDGNL